jgi:hypothetical protein
VKRVRHRIEGGNDIKHRKNLNRYTVWEKYIASSAGDGGGAGKMGNRCIKIPEESRE